MIAAKAEVKPAMLGNYWLQHGQWDDGQWSIQEFSSSFIDHRPIDHAFVSKARSVTSLIRSNAGEG
jgi:hypothetical protein